MEADGTLECPRVGISDLRIAVAVPGFDYQEIGLSVPWWRW